MTDDGYEYLHAEERDHALFVRLARPPVNAVNGAMYREIHRLFSTIDTAWPGAGAVVLSGDGKHFCAGNDLDEFMTMTPENARERMFHVREAFFAVQDCAVPVIGAVHGAALGTGLALAASCDIVVAAEGARFGLPEITVGVMGGAKHLSRLVPQPMVRKMFFTGRPVEPEALQRVGGIDSVVPLSELLDAAEALAREIVAHSPTGVRVAKRVLNDIETMNLKPGYQYEQGWTGVMSGHPDSKEAIAASRERRAPRFVPYDGRADRE
jgi:enoyl-CoA hydratase